MSTHDVVTITIVTFFTFEKERLYKRRCKISLQFFGLIKSALEFFKTTNVCAQNLHISLFKFEIFSQVPKGRHFKRLNSKHFFTRSSRYMYFIPKIYVTLGGKAICTESDKIISDLIEIKLQGEHLVTMWLYSFIRPYQNLLHVSKSVTHPLMATCIVTK